MPIWILLLLGGAAAYLLSKKGEEKVPPKNEKLLPKDEKTTFKGGGDDKRTIPSRETVSTEAIISSSYVNPQWSTEPCASAIAGLPKEKIAELYSMTSIYEMANEGVRSKNYTMLMSAIYYAEKANNAGQYSLAILCMREKADSMKLTSIKNKV